MESQDFEIAISLKITLSLNFAADGLGGDIFES